jgi:hypothetical protein
LFVQTKEKDRLKERERERESENPRGGRESVFVVEVDSVEDLGVSPANEARDSLGIPSSPLLSHAHMYTRTPSPLHTHTERERERERENPSVLVAS